MLHPLTRTPSSYTGRPSSADRDDVPDLGPGDADTEPDADDEEESVLSPARASTSPVVRADDLAAWDPTGWFALLFVGVVSLVRVGSGLVRGEGSSPTMVGLTTLVLLLTGLGIAELVHSWRHS